MEEQSDLEIDQVRASQNKIIGIIILYVIGLILYFMLDQDLTLQFVFFIVMFVMINTFYLILEIIKLFRARRKTQAS